MTQFIYRCSDCGREYDRERVRYLCLSCGSKQRPGEPLPGVLEAVFDYKAVSEKFDLRIPDWSLLCAVEKKFHPDFPVGGTPLISAKKLGAAFGFDDLRIKNDTLNPSGSLKDRASFLVAAEAIRLGEKRIAAASTGNAASSLAAVCAHAGLEAIIFVPEKAPKGKLLQMLIYGARVIRVKGSYDDAFRLSIEFSGKTGVLNRNTAYHPLTIEGKKTAAFEIFLQCGNRAPEAVVIPTGDGVILSGIYKGFKDLLYTGLIDRLPRIISVQAESSCAIHHFLATGKFRKASPVTIADSISVSAPSNLYMAAKAIRESGGFSILISDDEIRRAQYLLGKTVGVFAEPSSAAVAAALEKIGGNALDKSAPVILLITGNGLKDIEPALKEIELPEPVEPELEALPADLI